MSSAYDAVRNSQISAVVAIIVLIVVLYGGEKLGEIYHFSLDIEMDISGTEFNAEFTGIMMADEGKLTMDCDSALDALSEGECDESETSDYDDDEEDMMNNFRNLLYLSGASVVVFLVLLQNGDIKNASYAAFAIALLSSVAAIYFMNENTGIMESDNDEIGDDEIFNNFDFDGFWGSDSTTSTEDGIVLRIDGEWGPGIAWYLALLVIPLCGFYASYSCYSVESSSGGAFHQGGGFNEQYELPATQLPSIPSLGGPVAPPKTFDSVSVDSVPVQCVSCNSPFSVPSTASGQNFPCPHCGFVNLVN